VGRLRRKRAKYAKLTDADRDVLRRMANRLEGGMPELLRQARAVPLRGRGVGRPKGVSLYSDEAGYFGLLEIICRVAERDHGWSRRKTIRRFVASMNETFAPRRAIKGGGTPRATVERLARKLEDGGYSKHSVDFSRWRLDFGRPIGLVETLTPEEMAERFKKLEAIKDDPRYEKVVHGGNVTYRLRTKA